MHRIYKSLDDISRFNSWAVSEKLSKWEDFCAPWSKYHAVYEKLRDHIAISEQLCLSAYTEKPLGNNIHIDHFKKRSIFRELTFDYANMLVDDRNDNYGACFKDNRAGVTKNTFIGIDRIFNPVEESLSDFCDFLVNGEIIPLNGLSQNFHTRVCETIRVFNLNHKTLVNARKSIIDIVTECRKNGLEEADILQIVENLGFPSVQAWALRNVFYKN